MQSAVNRREFLGTSAAAGAALSLGMASTARAVAANDKIVIGVMGLSRGRALADMFSKRPGVVLKYVCDVDETRAASAATALAKNSDQPPQAIGEFRRILDDPEIDALICAAPNHWHAPATIMACAAGKHVYVEKPCSHNPQEGEWMVDAARKHKRAVQMGSQRRSSPRTIEGIQRLHEGVIGRVYHARAWYSNMRGPIGIGKPAEVPANLNYDLWQGPAPRLPYMDNRVHYNWHWFWHWGNGELGNNGIHTLDLCRWGLGVDYPSLVSTAGGRYRFEDDQETPDTHTVALHFPDRKMITWQGMSCNKHPKGFVEFYGEEGTMELDGNGNYTIFDGPDRVVEKVEGPRGDIQHIDNFLDAIRNDTPLELNAEILKGHKSTLLCHLGNIAYRTGRTLHCNPENGHILDDDAAMQLWKRDYEPGWEPTY